jgi:hypothetical protein
VVVVVVVVVAILFAAAILVRSAHREIYRRASKLIVESFQNE